MNKLAQKTIEVFAHFQGMPQPGLVGVLHVALSRGKEIFSFEYSLAWLKKSFAYYVKVNAVKVNA